MMGSSSIPCPVYHHEKASTRPGALLLPGLFSFSSVPSLRPLSASLFFHENLCFNSQISCVIHPVSLYREGKKFRSSKTLTRFASRLSLVHSVTPRLKTVHRTVFAAETSFLLPAAFESLSFQFIKKVTPLGGITFLAEKRGIRTLGAFIGHTRFPVVRLRPAQPSFHNGLLLCTLNSQVPYYYIRPLEKSQAFFVG